MNYAASLRLLHELFLRHDFQGHQAARRRHAATAPVDACANGSVISISFPGYKATPTNPDYRVDLTRNGASTSLSHANIIVDIFNKCTAGGMGVAALKKALQGQAADCALDYAALAQALPYRPAAPAAELLAAAQAAHGGKWYNKTGNQWDLSLEELFKSIQWIVIQEDVNYPIAKGYLGRKMPFGRYLEAIHVLEGHGYSLPEVIQRALAHARPRPWAGMDYSFEQRVR